MASHVVSLTFSQRKFISRQRHKKTPFWGFVLRQVQCALQGQLKKLNRDSEKLELFQCSMKTAKDLTSQ